MIASLLSVSSTSGFISSETEINLCVVYITIKTTRPPVTNPNWHGWLWTRAKPNKCLLNWQWIPKRSLVWELGVFTRKHPEVLKWHLCLKGVGRLTSERWALNRLIFRGIYQSPFSSHRDKPQSSYSLILNVGSWAEEAEKVQKDQELGWLLSCYSCCCYWHVLIWICFF